MSDTKILTWEQFKEQYKITQDTKRWKFYSPLALRYFECYRDAEAALYLAFDAYEHGVKDGLQAAQATGKEPGNTGDGCHSEENETGGMAGS